MLDSETRRRIDSARDILVGKVPDPKSQVEQITIALIYKFMDDMDAESEELGGNRKFFKGKFAKYGWAKLMSPGLGGYQVLNLYDEAISKMPENAGIPSLFRNIFKNAYLPYRDPETLKSFLKIIDDFEYDHSERLGDAFEYLLSILGSQGDAGQFRTPRHIIDFMVEAVDPQKDESILDPACGTAGFLISAYKHVIRANSAEGSEGAALSSSERKTLTENIKGYDISPDMVRLSLVNLYLHDFADPHIAEYDTLTSEEKWNEYADVILANPPFMSPKGGIKPHKRFSIQAKRSEVLFVDYIAEHLRPKGRAGVIVPEGIIFQSQNAYKKLREMLVKNYLYAVVSLPAGVFQPYSGVKTSILLMDKALAKKSDSLLFVKVENDGFDLGAQRRKVDNSDLPGALAALGDFHRRSVGGEKFDAEQYPNALLVKKEKIGENGEWNLSGERYGGSDDLRVGNYELVELGEVAEIIPGQSPAGKFYNDKKEGTPFYQGKSEFTEMYIGSPKKWTSKITKTAFKNDILMSVRAPVGPVNFATQKICIGRGLAAIRTNEEKINSIFLFYLLKEDESKIIGNNGAVFSSISKKEIQQIKIPLPPLNIQQEIVAEIEGYQKIVDGARAVVDNYKPQLQIDPDWEMVKLGDVCEINPQKKQISLLDNNLEVSFVPMAHLNEHQMTFDVKITKKLCEVLKSYTYFQDEDVLVAKVTPCFENGKAGIARNLNNTIGFGSSELYVFRSSEFILPEWVYFNITACEFRNTGKLSMTGTGGLQRIPRDFVKNYLIPLPPMKTQKKIVARIEEEQSRVDANIKLITLFEQKIKDKIASVWKKEEHAFEEKNMSNKTVAYYLGAGASAKRLPTVKDFPKYLGELETLIYGEMLLYLVGHCTSQEQKGEKKISQYPYREKIIQYLCKEYDEKNLENNIKYFWKELQQHNISQCSGGKQNLLTQLGNCHVEAIADININAVVDKIFPNQTQITYSPISLYKKILDILDTEHNLSKEDYLRILFAICGVMSFPNHYAKVFYYYFVKFFSLESKVRDLLETHTEQIKKESKARKDVLVKKAEKDTKEFTKEYKTILSKELKNNLEDVFAKIIQNVNNRNGKDELIETNELYFHLLKIIKELKQNISPDESSSIDAYARSLYTGSLYGRRDTDRLDGVKKIIVSLFLFLQSSLYLQYFAIKRKDNRTPTDPRYREFYDAIFNKDAFHIITWNYDNQIELLKDRFIQTKQTSLKFSPDMERKNDDYHIYKLNGTIPDGRLKEICDELNSIIETIRMHFTYDAPSLRFGFEEQEDKYKEFIEILKQNNSHIETLVIIGYSFPGDNRKTDYDIICNMPKLKNIYIQSREDNKKIEEKLQGWAREKGKNWEIKTIEESDEFFIPDTLRPNN